MLALIPSLGPVLALIPAVIVALVQGSTYLPVSNTTFVIIVLGLYLIIQQIEGNLITPRIVGQAIELPPVVVLVGVLVGTTVAGLPGTVLAAPIIATGRVLTTYALNKIMDREPFYRLETKKVEPVQLRPLAESMIATTQQQLQEKVQQIGQVLQSGTRDEEE